MTRKLQLALALSGLFGLPGIGAAAAPVYRCTGPTGATVYSNFPCPSKPSPAASESAAAAASASDASAECAERSRAINERFSTEAAAATVDIRRLREQMSVADGYSAAAPNAPLRAELAAAEDRLDASGRRQRHDLLELRKDCDAAPKTAGIAKTAAQ